MQEQILFASTNDNKLTRIKELLKGYSLDIISLHDITDTIKDPDETAANGPAIAAQKALGYFDGLSEKMPVLTQDDTIRFIGVSPDDNPGPFIKKPVVDTYGSFTDENAVQYYAGLADKYGGSIDMVFTYGHAIAMPIKESERNQFMILASESHLSCRLVNKPKGLEKVPGYFLAALMQVQIGAEWIYHTDLTEDQKISLDDDLKLSITSLLTQAKLV